MSEWNKDVQIREPVQIRQALSDIMIQCRGDFIEIVETYNESNEWELSKKICYSEIILLVGNTVIKIVWYLDNDSATLEENPSIIKRRILECIYWENWEKYRKVWEQDIAQSALASTIKYVIDHISSICPTQEDNGPWEMVLIDDERALSTVLNNFRQLLEVWIWDVWDEEIDWWESVKFCQNLELPDLKNVLINKYINVVQFLKKYLLDKWGYIRYTDNMHVDDFYRVCRDISEKIIEWRNIVLIYKARYESGKNTSIKKPWEQGVFDHRFLGIMPENIIEALLFFYSHCSTKENTFSNDWKYFLAYFLWVYTLVFEEYRYANTQELSKKIFLLLWRSALDVSDKKFIDFMRKLDERYKDTEGQSSSDFLDQLGEEDLKGLMGALQRLLMEII